MLAAVSALPPPLGVGATRTAAIGYAVQRSVNVRHGGTRHQHTPIVPSRTQRWPLKHEVASIQVLNTHSTMWAVCTSLPSCGGTT